MLPISSPPGATETVHAKRVLVLAPHFDDEVLGCGGLICALAAYGADIEVLFLTDSSGGLEAGSVDDSAAYSSLRRAEAEKALEILGTIGRVRWSGCLDLPDGGLHSRRQELAEGLAKAIESHSPDLLLVTSPLEVSGDHVATFLALHRLLTSIRPGYPLEPKVRDLTILAYEVNHLQHPNLLVDVSEHLEFLGQAMACYASQQERHDYWGAYLGRSKFRALTLPPEVEAVEAYRRLRLQDFTHWDASGLIRRLGGHFEPDPVDDGPLVSVVVRTHNRPKLLSEALASIAGSSYRQIEVLVVNDGGERPELPTEFPHRLELVHLETNRGRAGAANAGIEAATGQYVAFLDDDDRVEPDHYAVLVRAAAAAGVRVAYSDAAVGVYHLDGDHGWKLTERRLPYSRDFQPELLSVDNYIPFHTLLIERQLFAEVGEFDPAYPIFEDWEFLVRLAKKTPFHHVARVTCEYRQFRGAGFHVLGDRPRERADFLTMKARVIEAHRESVDSGVVARVVDQLRVEAVAAQEQTRREQERREQAEGEYHRVRGALQASEEHGRQLQVLEQRALQDLETSRAEKTALQKQVDELHAYQDEQSRHLQQAYDEIQRLTALVESMENTRAWKLHQKLQGLKS